MYLQKLQAIYSLLLQRKEKELERQNYKKLFPQFFEATVFLYMVLNLDNYIDAVLLNSDLRYSEKKVKKSELFVEFLNYYLETSHQDIRNICSLFLAPDNLRETVLFEYNFDKKNYFELVQKLFDSKFLDDIDVFVTEYYADEETQISICKKYSKFLDVPTNRNYEFWSLLQARGFLTLLTDMYMNYKAQHGYENRQAETLYKFISHEFSSYYHLFYQKSTTTKYDTFTQHYYDERRRFLFMFFGNADRGLDIVAYSFALPLRAFRSFLWKMNVDLQDLESYVRRMSDEQFNELKNAFYQICINSQPQLPDICAKGWKHVFHNPSLKEIKNEELYYESERFNKNWAVVKNEVGLDMGFTMYRGGKDDTVNTNANYLSKKDHKNYKDQGFSEFYINPDGFYGIATRKIFGNYLWGDFDKQEVSGWVCPRFWTTFLLYFMLIVVSPICASMFLFSGVENTKALVWLFIFGIPLPLLGFAYFLKYFISKTANILLNLMCKTDEKLKEFLENYIYKIQELCESKLGKKLLYVSAKILLYSFFITILSYAYDPIVTLAFAVIADYFISSYVKKAAYVPLSRLKYGYYAVFLLVSVHMIYARELIYEVSVYLFNVLHETYAFLFSIAMFIIAYYKLKDVSNSYLEIQDRYVMGKTGFNQQKIDLLFDKLMLVIVFAFFALFVIEVVFYVKLANIEHLFDSLYILSLFVGINLLLFIPSLFLFRRPVVLEYEKNRYAEWRLKVPSYFDDKDVIFALSSNAWLLQKFALNKDYYELFDSFAPEHGKAFRKLFIKYINRLDENFLGEVKILRSLLDSKNTFFSLKHMEKLVNTNMTAQEVYDYYVKLEASKSKIFKIVDFVIDLIGKIVISICYPFKRIWYLICAFFQSIANFYTFLVDTFHKMCPYSNASERI